MKTSLVFSLSAVAVLSMVNAKPECGAGKLGLTYRGQKWEDYFDGSDDYGDGKKGLNCENRGDRSRSNEGGRGKGGSSYAKRNYGGSINKGDGQSSGDFATRDQQYSSNGEGSGGVSFTIGPQGVKFNDDRDRRVGNQGSYVKSINSGNFPTGGQGSSYGISDSNIGYPSGAEGDSYIEGIYRENLPTGGQGRSYSVGGSGISYTTGSPGDSDIYGTVSGSLPAGGEGRIYDVSNSGISFTTGDQGSRYGSIAGDSGGSLTYGGQDTGYGESTYAGVSLREGSSSGSDVGNEGTPVTNMGYGKGNINNVYVL